MPQWIRSYFVPDVDSLCHTRCVSECSKCMYGHALTQPRMTCTRIRKRLPHRTYETKQQTRNSTSGRSTKKTKITKHKSHGQIRSSIFRSSFWLSPWAAASPPIPPTTFRIYPNVLCRRNCCWCPSHHGGEGGKFTPVRRRSDSTIRRRCCRR